MIQAVLHAAEEVLQIAFPAKVPNIFSHLPNNVLPLAMQINTNRLILTNASTATLLVLLVLALQTQSAYHAIVVKS